MSSNESLAGIVLSLLGTACLHLGLIAGQEMEPQAIQFPPTKGMHLILPYEVVDGDTIRFYYLVNGTARLYGINAPEVTGPEKKSGLEAKKYLASILPDVPVRAEFMGHEKYGRALISVFTADGKDISDLMEKAKHARPYLRRK